MAQPPLIDDDSFDRFADDDFADDDDLGEVDDECALMPDGQCLLAGSEFCDWECGRLG